MKEDGKRKLLDEMERKRKWRKRKGLEEKLTPFLNRRGEKDGRLGRQGVDWKSKQCSYQPRVRIWGELLL